MTEEMESYYCDLEFLFKTRKQPKFIKFLENRTSYFNQNNQDNK